MMAKKSVQWAPGDLLVPGLGMLLGLYYLYTVRGLPFLAQFYGGALSIICILLFLVAFFMVLLKNKGKFLSVKLTDKLASIAVTYKNLIILTAFTALFIALISIVGYFVASFFFVVITTSYLRYGDLKKNMKVGLIVTLVGFVLFFLFLKVDLPLDFITAKVKGVF
jgi:hypothetical protein